MLVLSCLNVFLTVAGIAAQIQIVFFLVFFADDSHNVVCLSFVQLLLRRHSQRQSVYQRQYDLSRPKNNLKSSWS